MTDGQLYGKSITDELQDRYQCGLTQESYDENKVYLSYDGDFKATVIIADTDAKRPRITHVSILNGLDLTPVFHYSEDLTRYRSSRRRFTLNDLCRVLNMLRYGNSR